MRFSRKRHIIESGTLPEHPGRRPEPGEAGKHCRLSGEKGRAAVLAAAAAALLTGYFSLCAFSGPPGRLLPGTTVAGIRIGGMTAEEAGRVLDREIGARLGNLLAEFTCGGKTYAVSGSAFPYDAGAVVRGLALAQSTVFPARGLRFLGALLGGERYPAHLSLSSPPAAVKEAAARLVDPDSQTTWTVTDTELVFRKGRSGPVLDQETLTAAVIMRMEDLLNGKISPGVGALTAPIRENVPPREPDLEAIREELRTPAADAYFDPSTHTVVPSVVGRDLETEQARRALADTKEGGECRVPLILTQPKVTTETYTALMYRDVLGEAVTHVGGTDSRIGNVALAGRYLNGTVLAPGETFSYLAVCGPYDTGHGYGMGAAYLGGKTVLTPGGGVCQGSSTLYVATLRANLETVERHSHGYEPSYVPGGLDATVAGSELDFRFRNNTDYPVRIEAWIDGNSDLHVVLRGTNTTGIRGEPYTVGRVVTRYAGTVYEPDETVPRGTTRKDPTRTAYNAVSVEAYNKLVDADGRVVDTVYLHRDNYRGRDAVILYHPDDAGMLGIDPAAGVKTLAPETERKET